MAIKYVSKREKRTRRHRRIRKKVIGTAERPRFCVSLTLKHIYLQMIDDEKGHTLVAVSTRDKDFTEKKVKSNLEGASILGQIMADKAKKAGVGNAVFDRGGYKYHGRIKAVAEAMRKSGFKF